MIIASTYSFKGATKHIKILHSRELDEVARAIQLSSATNALRKISSEKTMDGALLYSPESLNAMLKGILHPTGWAASAPNLKKQFREPRIHFGRSQFREMDGIKNGVGLEIQFGKYAFMGYDIFSKMIIFKKAGMIDCGIEVVATHQITDYMSTGVSDFDQILIDFKHRGESNIDIPVLVLGLGLTVDERRERAQKTKRFLKNPKLMIEAGEVDRPKKGALPGPK